MARDGNYLHRMTTLFAVNVSGVSFTYVIVIYDSYSITLMCYNVSTQNKFVKLMWSDMSELCPDICSRNVHKL